MVRFRAGRGITGGLRHGVSQIGYVVGKVGGLAKAATGVVFAQANSWSDRDFGEGST